MNTDTKRRILWSLPQPIFVFGCAFITASAIVYRWMDVGLLMAIMVWLPIPLFLILERIVPRRKEWLLNWRDVGVDLFWVLGTYLIWSPIFDNYYSTPISKFFFHLRDMSEFPFRLSASSVPGIVGMAILGIIAIEFIGYWAHRLQHRFLFLWRIHATHHHITKMSVGRTDRTHPLEFLGLNLGAAVVLAFLGASNAVVAVVIVFTVATTHMCHVNMPLTSGIFGWLFNTAELHQVHHSKELKESNHNYGCVVNIWDRIFGTFLYKQRVKQVGNGSGKKLSLLTQLSIPFFSNKKLRKL
jgi:sterol desaturase/sphingolipid hydroxylase (fatty acid hydroxylase superfamily)